MSGAGRDRGDAFAEIPYRLSRRVGGVRAGAHSSRWTGSGGMFRQFAPLMEDPDPRRIDLRMSARDPAGGLHVRRMAQRGAVTVHALVDLSGSMAFAGHARKMRLVAALCGSLAASATRIGDAFALTGCDATIRDDVTMPPTRRRGIEVEVMALLSNAEPRGVGAGGLLEAAERIAGRGRLVFLVSDFLVPLDLVERVLDALHRQEVVPVIVSDSSEGAALPDWGLTEVADLETGARRLLVLRPALARAWRDRAVERDRRLNGLFARHGRAAFRMADVFDAEALTRHLLDGV